MDKGITLDYSDNESEEVTTETYQPSCYDHSVKKILLIEQQIKALENPKENTNFCKICNAELKSQIHAKTHYISAKHKKNHELLSERLTCLPIEMLQENINISRFWNPNSAVVSKEIDSYCNLCNIPLMGQFVKENHQITEIHKWNLERCCDICHVKTISKEALIEHKFLSHQQELWPVNHDEYVLEIPAIYASPTMSSKNSPKAAATNTQTGLQPHAKWNCDVCHKTFEGEWQFNNHKVFFTHTTLEQLKIQHPPEIVDAVYSVKGCGLFCSLCDVKLTSIASTESHINCSKHVTRFEKLMQTIYYNVKGNVNLAPSCNPDSAVAWAVAVEEVDSYCNVCNITLVGQLVMESHQNAEIHKRNLEKYCDVCQVRTVSKEALAEHNFFSHKEELKKSNHDDGKDVSAIPTVSPTTSTKTSPSIERNTQTDWEQNVTWNCDVCHITFEEESTFIGHKEVFPHIVLEELKMQYRPEIVDAVCSVTNGHIFCSLCKAKVQSVVDTKFHLNCSRHVARFDKLLENLFVKEDIDNNTALVNSETEIIKETDAEEANTESEVIIPNTDTQKDVENNNLENKFFYCYLCKMEFDSKAKISVHAMSFPHVEVAKLKSQLISLGVSYAEYWILSKYYFSCTLCDAKITCEKVSEQHCSGLKHKQRLRRWCKEFSTWKCGPVVDPKYFLCKTCGVALVGTTEAELHYTMNSHLEKLEFYCEHCTVTNSTEDVVKEHDTSLEHQENISGDIDVSTSSKPREDDQENCRHKTPNPPKEKKSVPPPSDTDLEQQVRKELEKVLDTLYYSKSLPLDVSLKYAKKINKDICKLKRKYQKRAQISESSNNFAESDNGSESLDPMENNEVLSNKEEVKNEIINVDTKRPLFRPGYYRRDAYKAYSNKPEQTSSNNKEVEVITNKHEKNDVVSKIHSVKTTEVDFNTWSSKESVRSNSKKKKKLSVKKYMQELANKPIGKLLIKDKVDKVLTKNENDRISDNNSDEFVKPVDFKDNMLEIINIRKSEIDPWSDWNDYIDDDSDVELLHEFETLIKFIDSGDVPFDVILRYLRNCNTELEKITTSPQNIDFI